MSASEMSLLSLRDEGKQAQEQQQTLQQQPQQQRQQRVLDFIIVEDEEEGERQRRRWGWSNADDDGDDRSLARALSSSTGKAKAVLSSPPPSRPLPPPPPRPAGAEGAQARTLRTQRRFRYTDATLQSALFTAGVKPRLAKKVRGLSLSFFFLFFYCLGSFFLSFSLSLFLILFLSPLPNLSFYSSKQISKAVFAQLTASTPPQPPSPPSPAAAEGDEEAPHAPPLSSSTLPRAAFAALVAAASDALSKPEKRPFAALSRSSFETACGLVERRTPIALLLAGTSGSGKTTLAGLLAARLGGASVVSTDSVRHALASSLPPDSREAMLLRASTYEAGDLLVEWEREGESGGGGAGGPGPPRGGGAAAAAPPPLSLPPPRRLPPPLPLTLPP